MADENIFEELLREEAQPVDPQTVVWGLVALERAATSEEIERRESQYLNDPFVSWPIPFSDEKGIPEVTKIEAQHLLEEFGIEVWEFQQLMRVTPERNRSHD